MKKAVLLAATLALLSVPTLAQKGGGGVQEETIQRVRTYVVKQKPASAAVPSGFTVTTGAVLPETVAVQSFPADVGVTDYRYVVIGGQTVLVEPGSRRIVEVIR
jgi:hypothetical protein